MWFFHYILFISAWVISAWGILPALEVKIAFAADELILPVPPKARPLLRPLTKRVDIQPIKTLPPNHRKSGPVQPDSADSKTLLRPSNAGIILFVDIDRDEDESLSWDEMAQDRTDRHKQFDSNQDGLISEQEFLAISQPTEPDNIGTLIRNRKIERFRRYDQNDDQQISLEEYVAAGQAFLIQFDENGDGVLSLAEYDRPWRKVTSVID